MPCLLTTAEFNFRALILPNEHKNEYTLAILPGDNKDWVFEKKCRDCALVCCLANILSQVGKMVIL